MRNCVRCFFDRPMSLSDIAQGQSNSRQSRLSSVNMLRNSLVLRPSSTAGSHEGKIKVHPINRLECAKVCLKESQRPCVWHPQPSSASAPVTEARRSPLDAPREDHAGRPPALLILTPPTLMSNRMAWMTALSRLRTYDRSPFHTEYWEIFFLLWGRTAWGSRPASSVAGGCSACCAEQILDVSFSIPGYRRRFTSSPVVLSVSKES